jgi:GNAT superfamily N-acetyltransferase
MVRSSDLTWLGITGTGAGCIPLRSARVIEAVVGTALVRYAEKALHVLGCGKVNLQVRTTNEAVVRFYEGLGYDIEDRISLGRRL